MTETQSLHAREPDYQLPATLVKPTVRLAPNSVVHLSSRPKQRAEIPEMVLRYWFYLGSRSRGIHGLATSITLE